VVGECQEKGAPKWRVGLKKGTSTVRGGAWFAPFRVLTRSGVGVRDGREVAHCSSGEGANLVSGRKNQDRLSEKGKQDRRRSLPSANVLVKIDLRKVESTEEDRKN